MPEWLERILGWLPEGFIAEVLAAALYPVYLVLYTIFMGICAVAGYVLLGMFLLWFVFGSW